MPIHKLKLVGRRDVARGTVVFSFEKPEELTFIPGQYGGFTLINPPETDAGGLTRRFSLLNTPADEHIMVATRIQNSAFKRVLNGFAIGTEIKFAGPTGTFILHDDVSIPAVLIAGGIGIAPFYSMIKHSLSQNDSRPLYLFYGNQSRQDTAFIDELIALEAQYPNFTFIPTMAMPDPHWNGETGFITPSMIKKYVANLQVPQYYICGSPVMVTTLQETLAEMGINEDNIRVEDFPGY